MQCICYFHLWCKNLDMLKNQSNLFYRFNCYYSCWELTLQILHNSVWMGCTVKEVCLTKCHVINASWFTLLRNEVWSIKTDSPQSNYLVFYSKEEDWSIKIHLWTWTKKCVLPMVHLLSFLAFNCILVFMKGWEFAHFSKRWISCCHKCGT